MRQDVKNGKNPDAFRHQKLDKAQHFLREHNETQGPQAHDEGGHEFSKNIAVKDSHSRAKGMEGRGCNSCSCRNSLRKGLLNISGPGPIDVPGKFVPISGRECSKKSVQQGRSPFDARSVLSVREHGKRARTPLAAFFNIPRKEFLGVTRGSTSNFCRWPS